MLRFAPPNGTGYRRIDMVSPKPASKAAQAFRELIKLRHPDRSLGDIDEFTRIRLERAADESMSVDPVNAYQTLGALAALRWDGDAVRTYFERAVGYGGGHVALANYSRALYDLNQVRDASIPLEQAVLAAPEQLAYLKQAISNRLIVGDWEQALELLDMLELRAQDVGEDMLRARKVIKFAEKLGLRASTVGECVEVALNLLAKERLRVMGVSDVMDDIVEDSAIYFDVFVHAPPETAEDLDERLTPLLFDGVQDMQLSVFGLAIKSVQGGHGSH